jgi:DNA-binding IclR family transcriptional regulator
VIAALNVVYLRQRDAKVGVPVARAALAETAGAISRALGWMPSRRHRASAAPG